MGTRPYDESRWFHQVFHASSTSQLVSYHLQYNNSNIVFQKTEEGSNTMEHFIGYQFNTPVSSWGTISPIFRSSFALICTSSLPTSALISTRSCPLHQKKKWMTTIDKAYRQEKYARTAKGVHNSSKNRPVRWRIPGNMTDITADIPNFKTATSFNLPNTNCTISRTFRKESIVT